MAVRSRQTFFGDDVRLDMGSSWVHGTEDNPIMNFVNEFSLKYVGRL